MRGTEGPGAALEDLSRIDAALDAAAVVLQGFTPGAIDHRLKSGAGDPVTEADLALDRVLRERLLREGEGWLSEETADDARRLDCRRVWVVDPLDGTKEFVMGLPEWSVSIALVVDGEAVAGGILNPAAGHRVLGGLGHGVRLNGAQVEVLRRPSLDGGTVLASRSEVSRGEWQRFEGRSFAVVAMGSVAYKLARVAAGLDDATWTLVPKHEWDVAAGCALVRAAGGEVWTLDGRRPRFNQPRTLLSGLLAGGPALDAELVRSIVG